MSYFCTYLGCTRLTHQGEDCTFETMIKRFGLSDDAALCRIAEIVHDIDLKDNKFNRLEATGLDAVVRSLAKLLKEGNGEQWNRKPV